MMGYSKEEIIGRKGDIIFTEEDREKQPKIEMNRAKENGSAENERWHVRKDGSRFWGSGTMRLLRSSDERIIGFLKIMMDNTARKQMEETLMQTKEEAEQAAKAKEEFLAHMSHEIRTPLSAIAGLATLLLQQDPQPSQLEQLNALKFSAENLRLLINDILDFSKIQAGKVVMEATDINLRNLLHSLQKAHEPRATEQGSKLQVHIDDQLPEVVHTDQLKLSQVLNNLISNAVKFTQQGRVAVEVSLQRKKGKQLWVNFSVHDTGIGIPENKLSLIFDAFTQADNSTMRQYEGTGLGLSITKLLLANMGSEIQVESKEGDGSRFYFTLPMKEGKTKASLEVEKPLTQKAQTDLENLKLLLVEDYEINRKVFMEFLQVWWQLVPDEAENGKQALLMVQKKQYDLILMDVRMPVMDGYQAAK
jgi:PAS domain S-box-containing protein